MTCTVGEPRIIYRGSIEWIDVPVTADVQLDTQAVFISLVPYPYNWITATWQGTAGMVRTASILAGDANPLPDIDVTDVFVKVTDNPEVPIVLAGPLIIR